MRKLRWIAAGLVMSVLALTGCRALNLPPVSASREVAPAAGGGASLVVQRAGAMGEGVAVVGTGSVSVDPEIAHVTYGVELQGDDPDALVSEATAAMEAAMEAAKAFGILEDRTRTVEYNLWVETNRDRETGQPTGGGGYHLRHQVRVTTDQLDTVGELLASLVNSGVNSISGVTFSVEDLSALEQQAREEALADAEARAAHIADQMGLALGKPSFVTEIGGGGPVPVAQAFGLGGGAMREASAPDIESGSFTVSVNVQVVYTIQ